MGEIIRQTRTVDKIGEITIARTFIDAMMQRAADRLDQAAQDGEFQFQLDAVDGSLQGHLNHIPVDILDDDEYNVHDDVDGVRGDEFVFHLCAPATVVESVVVQQARGFADVQGRQDAFLHAEPGELESFHDVEAEIDGISVHVDGAEVKNGDGNDEDGGGDADKPYNDSKNLGTLQNEMQARVQDKGLAGHHEVPADRV